MEHDDVDMIGSEANNAAKRLKEMENEAAALREMKAKVEKEMNSVQDPGSAAESQVNREEVDSRSVFVGNVTVKRTNIPGMKAASSMPIQSIHGCSIQEPICYCSLFLPTKWIQESPEVQNANALRPYY